MFWTTRSLLLTIILVSSASFAASQIQPTGTGSIRGHVTLADTNGPATGTIISILPPPLKLSIPEEGEYIVFDQISRGQFHATVDSTGAYQIDKIPPGDFTVLTWLPGYISHDPADDPQPSHPDVQYLHVQAGQIIVHDLQLERGGSIEGTVRYADGRIAHIGKNVAAEVAVNLEKQTPDGHFARFGGAAHTDSDGHYVCMSLPPGTYLVFTALQGGTVTTTRGTSATGGLLMFAPSTVRPSKALRINLGRQETRKDVDVEIPVTGLHTISGKVVNSAGEPVTQGIVRLYPTNETNVSRASPLGKEGEFSFESMPDDRYVVSVEFAGEQEFVGITKDQTGIRMRMHKPLYRNITTEVSISGHNPAPLNLTATTNP
ncbi:carboxypeptidase-like regulatory domain-containing protein [Edaphobacter modestus]|uniref:Carboxypeptidase family protein n=1 Tax=Edaphobacter modestus TaxID=388466 RepID=A0A4Q7YTW7_9BACT|nr:carboxypeptidase-like regulatory domain-containing protein [Edaphobacter modestus]RZU40453.1 carboxypeptidase family protein [Edaphobacter modestus]